MSQNVQRGYFWDMILIQAFSISIILLQNLSSYQSNNKFYFVSVNQKTPKIPYPMLKFSEQNYLKENDLIESEPPFIPLLRKMQEEELKPDGM